MFKLLKRKHSFIYSSINGKTRTKNALSFRAWADTMTFKIVHKIRFNAFWC